MTKTFAAAAIALAALSGPVFASGMPLFGTLAPSLDFPGPEAPDSTPATASTRGS